MYKFLLSSVAALSLASAAQAQVAVQIWSNVPTSVSQNATIAQAAALGAPNATTTVGGINFSTLNSPGTTIGAWLNNPAGLAPAVAGADMNDVYMLFTGTIFLNSGANAFSIAHDDGLQLSLDGGIGMVVNQPGPTAPTTTPFNILAPSTGTYNFTLSYGECCEGPAVLQWSFLNGPPVGQAVPEPATWAMMLLGFAGIGMAMRRSRKPVVVQVA